MTENKIQKLIDEIFEKKIPYKMYDGTMTDAYLIEKQGRLVFEQILRSYLLDNRDEKIGSLEAKVFMYEQIISKSNFAPMIEKKEEVKQINQDEPCQ